MDPETNSNSQSIAHPPNLEVAHVLFMDIVSYSVLSMENQRETILRLQELVRKLPEFQAAQTRNELISLPTGDGMALAFFGDPSYPLRCAQQISSALRGNSQLLLR